MSISIYFQTMVRRLLTVTIVMFLLVSPAVSNTTGASFLKFYYQKKKGKSEQADRSKGDRQRPDVKEVPKSRKQPKPEVVKPKGRPDVKPIKINRPKIKKH
ncbi:hypothetical protein CPT03_04525 [Pedobacter ginsengisoli]|uniref:Uncharacterized protein n=2 Tax=Pedobacter ginsengisoli TaxID=363852 RepID=A0A2D1U2D9_9SPHI|nr:hypothetical protein CPT03_04525 [Pedobacter ginsengisoli]